MKSSVLNREISIPSELCVRSSVPKVVNFLVREFSSQFRPYEVLGDRAAKFLLVRGCHNVGYYNGTRLAQINNHFEFLSCEKCLDSLDKMSFYCFDHVLAVSFGQRLEIGIGINTGH